MRGVQEDKFQKVFDAAFPGWNCIHNYSHHRLGRIWVCWSEEVEVCPVLTSSQMITVWWRYKSMGDTFLCSFIYASNCPIERRELWREMEFISESVAGTTNPWIIQGDFNAALTKQEHSRFTDTSCGPYLESDSSSLPLSEKHKSLKFELRALNRDMYGDLPGRVKQAYADLFEKQTAAMQDPQ
ncbi:hypothetical protein HID58_002399, partial [Brassica napus]